MPSAEVEPEIELPSTAMRNGLASTLLATLAAVAVAACGDGGTSGSGGGGTSTGGTTSTGGDTGAGGTSTGGTSTGGSGGSTTTGGTGGNTTACTPGETQSCYSGPPETEGVGICAPGVQTCLGDGSGFGECVGDTLPVFENCATSADDDCDGAAPNCTGDHLWSRRLGGASKDEGFDVATDSAGFVLVTGSFQGDVDFGGGVLTSAGTYDVFVAKYDPFGNHIWSLRFGGATADEGFDIATDTGDNVLVTGRFTGAVDFGGGALTTAGGNDIFVAKYDPNGNHIWSERFGGSTGDEGQSIATDKDDNVVVAGTYEGIANFGGADFMTASDYNVFVAKYDPSGNHLWSHGFGGPMYEWEASVGTDNDGNVLFTGIFEGTASFGGPDLTSVGTGDIFVAKYDPDGNHLWSQSFGGALGDRGHGIVSDSQNDIVVTGLFQQTANFGGADLTSAGLFDVFVAKLDPDGNHVWSHRFGGPGYDDSYAVAVDSQNNIVITGLFDVTADFGGASLVSAGGHDVFIAKYDPAGNHAWSYRFGDTLHDYGNGVAIDPSDNVITTGVFQGTIDIGGGAFTSAGGQDAYVAKLAP